MEGGCTALLKHNKYQNECIKFYAIQIHNNTCYFIVKKRVTNPGVKSTGYAQNNKKITKIQVKYDNVIIGHNNTCIY